MIGVYALADSAVTLVATAATEAAALAALALLRVPAVACDGGLCVGATGHTSQADLAVILAAVRPAHDHGGRSCTWPGCVAPSTVATTRCPAAVLDYCAAHRRRLRAGLRWRGITDDSVEDYVARHAEVPCG